VITYTDRTGQLMIVDLEYVTAAEVKLMLAGAAPSSRAQLRADLDLLLGQEARWRAAATPEQHAISWGDHWRRTWQSEDGALEMQIWGRVHTEEEITAAEERLHVPAAEVSVIRARIRAGYERGWRYGRCWSLLVPDGELGSTHVATVERVTAEEFGAAKRAGWVQ